MPDNAHGSVDAQENGQPGRESWLKLDVHPWVFFTSVAIILLFVVLTIIFENTVDNLFHKLQGWVSTYTGWFFVSTMNIILIYVVILAVGRFGGIRLGGEGAKPEFSTMAWFAMVFSAGMGIGLLFYGVAEPMFHFVARPMAEPGTVEAARVAMDFTFLHWGLHPWGIYALVGLALAFFAFNKGLPLSIRAVFHPLIGDRIYGPVGNIIDIMATVATMFGVATSLGFGVQQVNAGLSHLFDFIPQTTGIQLVLIAGIAGLATWSVVRGLDAGIRRLSELNVISAALLMLFVLLEDFPLSSITSIVAIIVVVTFFVTSSDSGSLVIDIITAGGNTQPPKIQRIFWAIAESGVAAALLIGGGMVALQTAAISTGLPFAIVLLGMCWALHRGMSHYQSGQAFSVSIAEYDGPALRTTATRRMPTFGRRQCWLPAPRPVGPAMRVKPTMGGDT